MLQFYVTKGRGNWVIHSLALISHWFQLPGLLGYLAYSWGSFCGTAENTWEEKQKESTAEVESCHVPEPFLLKLQIISE